MGVLRPAVLTRTWLGLSLLILLRDLWVAALTVFYFAVAVRVLGVWLGRDCLPTTHAEDSEMPVNRSTNKVRVTKLFGSGADNTIGLMDPAVNMRVKRGIDTRWITAVNADKSLASLAQTSGGTVVAKAYPHELTIDSGNVAEFGWPSVNTAVALGHDGVFPNGVPVARPSGITFFDGEGVPSVADR